MFLTSHALIALSSTKFIHDPMSLFFINFFLHYVLDAIPHGEESGITGGFKDINKDILILVIADILFIIIIVSMFSSYINYNITNALFAIFGACIPDILWGIYRVTKLKIFKWSDLLNDSAHKILKIKQGSVLYFSFQLIPIIIFLICFFPTK